MYQIHLDNSGVIWTILVYTLQVANSGFVFYTASNTEEILPANIAPTRSLDQIKLGFCDLGFCIYFAKYFIFLFILHSIRLAAKLCVDFCSKQGQLGIQV